jgi:hypothetical protein
MKKDIHHDLNRLVDYHFSILEFGWAPTSILHRVATEGHVDRGRPGPNILCPDMPWDLAKLQRAFLAVSSSDQHIIAAQFMPYSVYVPEKKQFRKAAPNERARFVGLDTRTFRRRYLAAAERVKRVMNARQE